MSTYEPPLHDFLVTKMTPGQRKALLAGIDADGRLPDGIVSARVLATIPEAWACTDAKTGSRFLTPKGRAVLTTVDRYEALRRADPQTGVVSVRWHRDGMAMARDGLVVFQSSDGRIQEATELWRTMARPYITERGRRLVGMPLTAPPFAARLPVGSRAMRVQEGKPAERVEVRGWPYSDGKVLVRPLTPDLYWRSCLEIEVPASEIHPC